MNRESIIAVTLAVENEMYVRAASQCVAKCMPLVHNAYEMCTGRRAPLLPLITLQVNEWDLPEGKVGSYKLPNEVHPSEGILTVHPEAFTGQKAPYWFVIAHELIHAFLGLDSESHQGDFVVIADELGIPEKYRD